MTVATDSDLVELSGSRSAWLVGPSKLAWRPVLLPRSLPAGSVLLEILLTGVCGTDRHLYGYAAASGRELATTPSGLGHEFVARVVRTVGTVVNTAGEQLSEGDRVIVYPSAWGCGQCFSCRVLLSPNICLRPPAAHASSAGGSFATHYLAPPGSFFYRVPTTIPDELAVLVEPLAGASRAVERAFLSVAPDRGDASQFGCCAIVQGSGAIGALVTALLASRGTDVSAIGAPEQRLEVIAAMGARATVVLDGSMRLTTRQIQALRQRTPHGLGTDIVIEASGTPTAFTDAIELTRPGGTVVEFGAYTDRGMAQVSPTSICRKDLTIMGSNGYAPRQFGVALGILQSPTGEVLRQVTTRMVSLDDLPEVLSRPTEEDVMKVLVRP